MTAPTRAWFLSDATYLEPGHAVGGFPALTTGRAGIGTAMQVYYCDDFAVPAHAEGIFGFSLHMAEWTTSTPLNNDFCNISEGQVAQTTFASAVASHLLLGFEAGTQKMVIKRGATVLATAAAADSGISNQATYIEVAYKIADSGGYCHVYLNGSTTPHVSVTGADTKNGGTTGLIDHVGLWKAMTAGNHKVIADVYFLDNTAAGTPSTTKLGDIRNILLVPSAAGDSTQWTPSTGANYTTVDENPIAIGDYVGTAVSGNKDLYTMTDLPAGYTPLGVALEAAAAKSDAGAQPGELKVVEKENSVERDTSVAAVGALITGYTRLVTTPQANAPDAVAWTRTKVNAMQAGVKLV